MKKYFEPEMTINRFELESVVTESGGAVDNWENGQTGTVKRISMKDLKEVQLIF